MLVRKLELKRHHKRLHLVQAVAGKREDCTFPIASQSIAEFGARSAPYESTADSGTPTDLQESDGERQRSIDSNYNKQQNGETVVKAVIECNSNV